MFISTIEQQFTSIAISGGGGGKGGGKGKGGEVPDSLRSEATLLALIGICEGEVEDFSSIEELEKSVYLNSTPIRNADNTRNFENCEVAFSPGTQDQAELPGFAGRTESDFDVNQAIRRDQGPVVRYLSDPAANLLRITLALPGLVEQKENRVVGSTVDLDVKITDKTGAILTNDSAGAPGFQRWTISGKSTSQYETRQEFPLSGESPYRVEIVRQTEDSKDSKKRNDVVWARYTLINFDRLRHPFIAKLGLKISSRDFAGIPEIGIRGVRLKCALPHNYDPITRTYTGIFDGRFTGYGWTNNPAYILRQLLTSTRFGVGDEIDPLIHDNFSLYRIGKYCDQPVTGAFGEQEPRYTLNGIIANRDDADKQLTLIGEHIRALWYYASGTIQYLQDVPREISRVYTEANTLQTVDEQGRITRPCFEYEGTGRKARHTAVVVRFRNRENFHRPDTAYYADQEGITRYGYNLKELDLPYCDSLGQALREAKALVLTEKYQTETVKLRVGSEGQIVSLGQIAAIADPTKQQGRYGGRIKSVSANLKTITLDAPFNLLPGRTYTMMVDCFKQTITCNLSAVGVTPHLVTGTGFSYALLKARVGQARVVDVLSTTQLILDKDPGLGTGVGVAVDYWLDNLQMSRAVITPAGLTDQIELLSPLPARPPKHGTWLLSDNQQPLKQYQIITINKNSDTEYELIGIQYSAQKFAELEQRGEPLETTKTLTPPRILAIKAANYEDELTIGWQVEEVTEFGRSVPNPNNAGYIVRYRSPGDNWISLPRTGLPSAIIYPIRQGEPYQVQVAAVDLLGAAHWSEIVTTGKTISNNAASADLNQYTLLEV